MKFHTQDEPVCRNNTSGKYKELWLAFAEVPAGSWLVITLENVPQARSAYAAVRRLSKRRKNLGVADVMTSENTVSVQKVQQGGATK